MHSQAQKIVAQDRNEFRGETCKHLCWLCHPATIGGQIRRAPQLRRDRRPKFVGRLSVNKDRRGVWSRRSPPTSLVELDRWNSCRDPQLLVTLVACPSLKVPKQQPSSTCASAISTNDHAQHPRRSVASFLNVKLTQADRTQCSTVVAGHPGHGQLASARFTQCGRPPPVTIGGSRWVSPLKPAQIRHCFDQIHPVGEEIDSGPLGLGLFNHNSHQTPTWASAQAIPTEPTVPRLLEHRAGSVQPPGRASQGRQVSPADGQVQPC